MAMLVPRTERESSWEQLPDWPIDVGGALPGGLNTASGRSDPGVAAWPAAAEGPEGSVLLATQPAGSPMLPVALPATQPIASLLQQPQQLQPEQAGHQASLQRVSSTKQQAEQEQDGRQQQHALQHKLLLQTQLQEEEPALADLLQTAPPESPQCRKQHQHQRKADVAQQPEQQSMPSAFNTVEERQQQQLEDLQQQQYDQQAGRGAEQPEAPRQVSADENEQPAERNSQEQPHARRPPARAAKRPAHIDADDAAAGQDAAAAAPPAKRGRAAQRSRQWQQPHQAAMARQPAAEASECEADCREAAAAAVEEPVQPLPRQLLQEPPTPIEGADCGLPPAPLRWEGHAPEPLTQQALVALAAQDAAMHDQHLRLLRFDDRLAELASQSGLLVRFHVRTIRSYHAQAEVVVEAPQFLTVEYLKRRVARAKLQRGELLPTTRFVLRKKVNGSQALNHDSATAGPTVGVGLEDLPSCMPAGDEVFLADLGYRAPGPYELCIASAPQTSDQEQQESMLADLMVQAQAHQCQRQTAAAGAAAASRAAQPPELQDAALSYRALLQAAPSVEDGGSGRRPSQRRRRSRVSSGEGGPSAEGSLPAAAPAVMAGNHSTGASAATGRLSLIGEGERSRRQAARWNVEEVASLIEGVQAHGTRWAHVYQSQVGLGRISQQRTQVDLKDKWRNLVRLVTEPGKQARSIDLTEEQRQAILDVVFAKQAANAPASAQRAAPDGSPGGRQAAVVNVDADNAAGELDVTAVDALGVEPANERQREPASNNPSNGGGTGEAETAR